MMSYALSTLKNIKYMVFALIHDMLHVMTTWEWKINFDADIYQIDGGIDKISTSTERRRDL